MPPSGEPPANMKPRKGQRFRRFEERAIVKSLVGIAAFLFIVACVMGYAQLKTIDELQAANRRFTQGVCVQIVSLRQARSREESLSYTDNTPRKRQAHRRSARELSGTIGFLSAVVDCTDVDVPSKRLLPTRRRSNGP